MEEYIIEMELLSEAIFGSGHAVSGSVDQEVLYDDLGLPYLRAKAFKGNLRSRAEELIKASGLGDQSLIEGLFGRQNQGFEEEACLRFSDCQIAKSIRENLRARVLEGSLDPQEIKSALTSTRDYFTTDPETGASIDGSLRTLRTIKRGLVFTLDLEVNRELSSLEKFILAGSLLMLKNIGGRKSRGKGRIACRLYKNSKDVTYYYLEGLEGGGEDLYLSYL